MQVAGLEFSPSVEERQRERERERFRSVASQEVTEPASEREGGREGENSRESVRLSGCPVRENMPVGSKWAVCGRGQAGSKRRVRTFHQPHINECNVMSCHAPALMVTSPT